MLNYFTKNNILGGIQIHAFRISNNALQKMAMAWGCLQKLELGGLGWAGQSRLSLA
jgi:hypothetical protein